jgi:thiamine biosynthesis lipoprotein
MGAPVHAPVHARASFPALGTGAVVVVTEGAALDAASAAIQAELAEIDLACSRFRADSELTAVNAAAGHWAPASALLLDAVGAALRAARLTGGDVTPTVGEAMVLLGYDRDFAALPALDRAPVVRAGAVPGWQAIRLDRRRGRLRVPAGVQLDLGATAKALAADRAAARVVAAVGGGCGVLVGLGGDIATAGPAPAGGWRIRVTDWHGAGPQAPGQTVRLDGGAVATSSTTVRHWRRGGERIHHIVDPATGRPAPVVWRTVSVAAATCLDANVAATAAIVRGAAAPAWLGALGLSARLVRPDGRVTRVAGWPPDAGEEVDAA